ncbi:MAG: hypothetical protein E7564_08990 [Ruminococcaceae bacterium]|nr:hypothetical protein [Oscillospiraceae bacterium]
MKFFKHLKFDLTYGNFKNSFLIKLIVWVSFVVFACFEVRGATLRYTDVSFTVGDYLYYIFSGVREDYLMLEFPYMWIVPHILILFFTLHYANDDLMGYGQQMILRSGKRNLWWLSKCVWNISNVTIWYLIAWFIITVFSLLNGAVFSLGISEKMRGIKEYGTLITVQEVPNWNLWFEITFMPLLTTVALSVLQMGLGMLINPAAAYIFSAVVLIASSGTLSIYLFGNYSMAIRSIKLVKNGLSISEGITGIVILLIIGIVTGLAAIRKYNILSKE